METLRFSAFHFIHFAISQPNRNVWSSIMAHLKANLVLYQSYKYELPNIFNGDRALDRIQHSKGGGGGGGEVVHTKSMGRTCVARQS